MTRKKGARELEQIQDNLEYSGKNLRVFIADLLPYGEMSDEQMSDRMLEVESLVNTFGGVVILKHIQKKSKPDYNTYIGEGKLEEIIEEMRQQKANILIMGNILKSHQIYTINESLRDIGAKAWDRVDLILKIFEKHAKSKEAKLQIELAAIKHMGPRIFGMGMELSRQGGGSNLARGKGETNTEIMKRHLRKKQDNIKKDLEKYSRVRSEHRKGREKKGFSTIGIVGYTNAGKSSLFNGLTKKGVLSEDKLFATLGTSVGKLWIPPLTPPYKGGGKEVLLNDTIGFIRDLPPGLIEAFSSTLEDSIESDILFHVADSNDPKIEEKIGIVDDILNKIGASQKKIYVFNKIDLLSKSELKKLKNKFKELNPIYVSSYNKEGFEDLKKEVLRFI